MNKTELVKAIATKAKFKQSDTGKVVKSFIETVSEELKSKGKVTLLGFGTFKVVHRKAKTGINPMTGAKIQIPPKDVPVFKSSKTFKTNGRG